MPTVQPGRPGAARLRRGRQRLHRAGPRRPATGRPCSPWPGVYPAPWTPVDSLVIQGDLTQELDFTTTPLDYALLERSLGAARTMAWFPVLPANTQTPYDPGPYTKLALIPLATGAASTLDRPAGARQHCPRPPAHRRQLTAATSPLPADVHRRLARGRSGAPSAEAQAAGTLLAQRQPAARRAGAPVPGQQRVGRQRARGHRRRRAAGRRPAPAADAPVGLVPGGAVRARVSRSPGSACRACPACCIGHNAHIAWSLTDTQNQATLFYAEQTSKSRPGQYYWDGAWRPMRQVHYTIPVRGGAPVHADRGHHRARADHDPGRADDGGRLDGQRPLRRPGRAARDQPGAATSPSSTRRWRTGARPRRTSSTPTTAGNIGRDLGRRTTRWSAHGAARGCRCPAPAPRRDRRHPLPGGAAGLRPAGARGRHRQPAAGRRRPTRTTSAPAPTSSIPATGPARSTPRCDRRAARLTPASFAAVQTSVTDPLAAAHRARGCWPRCASRPAVR